MLLSRRYLSKEHTPLRDRHSLKVASQISLAAQRGQGMAEYIIIAVLVAIIVIVGVRYFGGSVGEKFQNATEQVANLETGAAEGSGTSTEKPSTGTGASTEPAGGESGGEAGEGGDSGGSDIDRLKAGSVGARERPVTEEIELDWRTLGFIAAIACGIGLFIVFRTNEDPEKKKKRKKKKLFARRSKSEEGQAMVEFLFVAITFLFTILGVIQLAMCLNAYTMVRYAAYNAARAAIVHGGDKERMLEAARISLLPIYPRHGRSDHLHGYIENYLGARATDHVEGMTFYRFKKGSDTELEFITDATILNGVPEGDVATFDDPAQADDGIITAQVVHQYELVIPLVNRILFYVYTKWRSGEGYGGQTLDNLSRVTDVSRRTGAFRDIEYRIPIVAHYTMRLQSDYAP